MKIFADVFSSMARDKTVHFCAEVMASKKLKLKRQFAKNLQNYFGKKIRSVTDFQALMTRFHINRSPKINTENTKLLAIAATVITAAWIADTVKEAKNYPFLCSYGSRPPATLTSMCKGNSVA
ncbi:hypothetical protein L596_025897 [Steinernema carpocapsae]|nr:hypothetical protein L596_025897 [Steinernema carpocapsae]